MLSGLLRVTELDRNSATVCYRTVDSRDTLGVGGRPARDKGCCSLMFSFPGPRQRLEQTSRASSQAHPYAMLATGNM